MRKTLIIATALLTVSCTDADIASRNLSKAADMFEIDRRIVFYDAIQGKYLLTIIGKCSVEGGRTSQLSVTCKGAKGSYKKHFLGLSDNVTYIAEQLEPADVGTYQYRVIFKPESVVPNIDLITSF